MAKLTKDTLGEAPISNSQSQARKGQTCYPSMQVLIQTSYPSMQSADKLSQHA